VSDQPRGTSPGERAAAARADARGEARREAAWAGTGTRGEAAWAGTGTQGEAAWAGTGTRGEAAWAGTGTRDGAGTAARGSAGRERALRALRTAIRAGDLAPGQRLIEGEIAEQLGVTRASVRVALLDLAADGLVERIPNRGARVRPVSLAEAVQITECRMMLEGLCAAKAAERATGEQTAYLADLGVRLRAAVEAGEPLKYSQLNSELHRYVQVMSGQDIAMGLLDRLNAQLVRHQFRLALQPGRSQVSLGEHLEIVEAVLARDPARAERAARSHLLSVITALTDVDSQSSHPMKQLHNVR
jgi:DNA-binding GntR family transcriptional regulator